MNLCILFLKVSVDSVSSSASSKSLTETLRQGCQLKVADIAAYFGDQVQNCPYLLENVYIPKYDPVPLSFSSTESAYFAFVFVFLVLFFSKTFCHISYDREGKRVEQGDRKMT